MKVQIPKLNFQFNKKEDMWNIWDICNSSSSYGKSWKNAVTQNIHKICDRKKYEECEKELEKTMSYIYENLLTKEVAKEFSNSWKKIEKSYFSNLKKIMKSEFPFERVNVHLTTAGRCPYDPDHNPPSFFVNLWSGIPNLLEVAGHELMHIHFHNSKYWKICEKEIGREKTFDLKEALTVLLNTDDFFNLWLVEDRGYPGHKNLREYIFNEWKKNQDFDSLINNSIKWIKKNEIK